MVLHLREILTMPHQSAMLHWCGHRFRAAELGGPSVLALQRLVELVHVNIGNRVGWCLLKLVQDLLGCHLFGELWIEDGFESNRGVEAGEALGRHGSAFWVEHHGAVFSIVVDLAGDRAFRFVRGGFFGGVRGEDASCKVKDDCCHLWGIFVKLGG